MEIIEHKMNERLPLPDSFVSMYKDLNFAIFDIETTGLNPLYARVILIGILYIKNNELIIQQFFCNHRGEERELLLSFEEKIKEFDLLINYNGNTFDIPFLNKRFSEKQVDCRINPCKSLDLLKLVRSLQNQLNLKNCKLKALEEFLGIYRNDTISGKESVTLYTEFEKSQSPDLKEIILLHNYDDLYFLGKSLKIMDHAPRNILLNCLPKVLPIDHEKMIYLSKQSIIKGSLHVEGHFDSSIDNYVLYENTFHFNYKGQSHTFELELPLYKGQLPSGEKCLYVDGNDFPFSYVKRLVNPYIPENILIFKEDKVMKPQEIYHFVTILLQYIFQKINYR